LLHTCVVNRAAPLASTLPLHCLKVVQVDKQYGDSPPKIPSTNINYHR
jgi:hypothetical protein